jgi:hypothetical protein
MCEKTVPIFFLRDWLFPVRGAAPAKAGKSPLAPPYGKGGMGGFSQFGDFIRVMKIDELAKSLQNDGFVKSSPAKAGQGAQ